jgi:hypothetical protein
MVLDRAVQARWQRWQRRERFCRERTRCPRGLRGPNTKNDAGLGRGAKNGCGLWRGGRRKNLLLLNRPFRYAYGAKTTVESCSLIDVIHWSRLGYFRSPRWFSWAWARDGERVASITVETQRDSATLKYKSRSYGEDWSDVEQRVAIDWTPCRFGGERPWFVCSAASNGVYCGRRWHARSVAV